MTSSDQLGSAQRSSALSQYSLKISPDPYQIRITRNCFVFYLKSSGLEFECDSDLFCSEKHVAFYMAQRSSDLFDSDLFNSEKLRILPWSLVFDTPIFQILAFYLDFEGAKNLHVL